MNTRIATCVVGIAAFAFPAIAGAQDMTPNGSRILSDPNFLPLSGQFWGYTDYVHTFTTGSNYNGLGAKTSSFHINNDDIQQYFGYGITDDLEVDATIHYEPDTTRRVNFPNGTSAEFDSSGFSNPTFGATYRVLDQRVMPVTLDVFGSYTPDAFPAKAASGNNDGTIASGGQSGTVGAALAEQMRMFTIRGSAYADFVGRQKSYNPATDVTVDQRGHTNYVLALETQTRLSDQLSINVGASYAIATDSDRLNVSNGVNSISHPGNTVGANVALNYHFIPNVLVGSVQYRYASTADGSDIFAMPASNNFVRNRQSNAVGVRLDYAMP